MKRIGLLGIICSISFLLLASCASDPGSMYTPRAQPDLLHENWIPRININPNLWAQNASNWFLNGEPTPAEQFNHTAAAKYAITTMMVRVPNFTKVHVDGPFHIQFIGNVTHNSVWIIGPNAEALQARVEVGGDVLYIHPTKNCHNPLLNRVIIRIGVANLKSLVNTGTGCIEGSNISSDGLNIVSTNRSNILLAGHINLLHVMQTGAGSTTVMGAYTHNLAIQVRGNGTVNVGGHVDVRSINNEGNGKVHILGAMSRCLTIYGSGCSTTTVRGYAQVKQITAVGHSRIFVYWAISRGINVRSFDQAQVGLAGYTPTLHYEGFGASRFDGSYLRADNIYALTHDYAHANVFPSNRLFAGAFDASSIYYFGSPAIMSRNTSGSGIVIPVWCNIPPPPLELMPPPPAQWYWARPPIVSSPASFKGEVSFKGERAYN